MKKYIMSFLAALFTLTGCYDLDRAPYDQLSSSTFWQTEDQCKQGLMGVYASLKNTDLYGKMFMIDVNSDVAAGYDQYEALQLGTCTPRTGFLNGKWQNGYNAIQRANLAIRSIGEAPIDEVPKNQMLGEARFLRALIYFHLLGLFRRTSHIRRNDRSGKRVQQPTETQKFCRRNTCFYPCRPGKGIGRRTSRPMERCKLRTCYIFSSPGPVG